MKLNMTELEALAVQRALFKEAAELPFAVKTPDGMLFCRLQSTETSVNSSCGCGAEVVLVSKNVVVVQVVRCVHHGAKTYQDTYAVLGTEPGFAHLRPDAKPHYEPSLHPPLVCDEQDIVH
jgi:hypothetical protein